MPTINHQPQYVAKRIINHCLSTGRQFIYITGNGGSGKTALSKIISQEASSFGNVNVLSMDDFVVDTELRNNSTATWTDVENKTHTGRYTTSCAGSYFLTSIKAIIHNLEKGNNYIHWPKKATSSDECHLLHGDAILTIIEGVGTVFLEKDPKTSIGIFLKCQPEIEITRRMKRMEISNEQSESEVRQKFAERNSQYKANIEPHENEYELVLESLKDFSIGVIRDDYGVLLIQ